MPEVAVVVATFRRADRLRVLLDGLADQVRDLGRVEVIVVHEPLPDAATALVLAEHSLAANGTLKARPGSRGTSAARMRNVGWRAARAPLIAFTDDDCRPAPEWLDQLLSAAHRAPGAVVQGRTVPEPADRAVLEQTPWFRTVSVDPPSLEAQTCNIAYPRELLQRLEGFDEEHYPAAGEDTDLCARAVELGAPRLAAPEAVVYHAIEPIGLLGALRVTQRWDAMAYVYKRHPALRSGATLGIFWKPRHPLVLLALIGALTALRHRPLGLLCLPYLWRVRPSRQALAQSPGPTVAVLLGRGLIDLAEVAALARGSLRSRTLFL